MELAVRNYFSAQFYAKTGDKQQKNRHFRAVFSFILGGPDGIRTRDLGLDRAAC